MGGNGEPQQDSEQSTRLKQSFQGHRRRGRAEERRAFWAEATVHAKALRHERVWYVPRALRKLVRFRV